MARIADSFLFRAEAARLDWLRIAGHQTPKGRQIGAAGGKAAIDPKTLRTRTGDIHLSWGCAAGLGVPLAPFTVWTRSKTDPVLEERRAVPLPGGGRHRPLVGRSRGGVRRGDLHRRRPRARGRAVSLAHVAVAARRRGRCRRPGRACHERDAARAHLGCHRRSAGERLHDVAADRAARRPRQRRRLEAGRAGRAAGRPAVDRDVVRLPRPGAADGAAATRRGGGRPPPARRSAGRVVAVHAERPRRSAVDGARSEAARRGGARRPPAADSRAVRRVAGVPAVADHAPARGARPAAGRPDVVARHDGGPRALATADGAGADRSVPQPRDRFRLRLRRRAPGRGADRRRQQRLPRHRRLRRARAAPERGCGDGRVRAGTRPARRRARPDGAGQQPRRAGAAARRGRGVAGVGARRLGPAPGHGRPRPHDRVGGRPVRARLRGSGREPAAASRSAGDSGRSRSRPRPRPRSRRRSSTARRRSRSAAAAARWATPSR